MTPTGILNEAGTEAACPRCGTTYEISPAHYGMVMACQTCAVEFLILGGPTEVQPLEPAASESVEPAPAPTEWMDCRPILRCHGEVVWAKVEAARDAIHAKLLQAFADERVVARVLPSGPMVFPAAVTIDCWIPQGDPFVTERVWARLMIRPVPYHRYELEYDVYLRARKFSFCRRLWLLPDEDLVGLVRHLLGRGRRPRFRRHQVRTWLFQFWKPKNRPLRLRRDWLLLGTAASWLGTLTVANDLVQRVAFLRQAGDFGANWPRWCLAVFVLAVGAGYLWLAVSLTPSIWRRRLLVRSSGKPELDPRELVSGDSWHAVLAGVGYERQDFKERLLRKLQDATPAILRFREERLWYAGGVEVEEREQIVVWKGRAVVFCQIYQYERDLYVGWDGHLNRGCWAESIIARGVDRTTKVPTRVALTVPSEADLSEYDLADLTFLSEWVHTQMSRLVKQLMEEKRIDQELDFRVVRQDRPYPRAGERGGGPGMRGQFLRSPIKLAAALGQRIRKAAFRRTA